MCKDSKLSVQKLRETQTVMCGGVFQPWISGLGKVCVAQQLSVLEHSPAIQVDLASPGAHCGLEAHWSHHAWLFAFRSHQKIWSWNVNSAKWSIQKL